MFYLSQYVLENRIWQRFEKQFPFQLKKSLREKQSLLSSAIWMEHPECYFKLNEICLETTHTSFDIYVPTWPPRASKLTYLFISYYESSFFKMIDELQTFFDCPKVTATRKWWPLRPAKSESNEGR